MLKSIHIRIFFVGFISLSSSSLLVCEIQLNSFSTKKTSLILLPSVCRSEIFFSSPWITHRFRFSFISELTKNCHESDVESQPYLTSIFRPQVPRGQRPIPGHLQSHNVGRIRVYQYMQTKRMTQVHIIYKKTKTKTALIHGQSGYKLTCNEIF